MKTFLISLALCLPFFASQALADSVFVEGHIRDLRTGTPIRAAVVSLTDPLYASPHLQLYVVGKSVFTDDSGFYSIELAEEELDRGYLEISATCTTRKKVRKTDPLTHRLVLRPGTIRRDLYIDAFRSRRKRTCRFVVEAGD